MSDYPHIPGYEIESELGRGGMAVVYSAIETNLGRQVAIKVVTAAAGEADGQIGRLENEARGLAALHHPHVVDLYSFGRTADGSLFYVMPLLPGGSLEDWPRPVPEARVVALLDDVLDALGHAHAMDIIHRDIKPANILFDRHDRPLLADFGAAFLRRRASRLTNHGAAIGSSGYMSPEQARGQDVDARSDLYSTAVLAFELLVGQRPFEGPDDLSIAIAQTEQPVPTLPPPLRHWQSFFNRALAVNPQQRFADAAAMRAAMHGLRGASPDAAPSRHGLWMLVGAAVLLVGVLAFAVSRWRQPAEPVHAAAVEALLHAGKLTPPDEPSALAELVRARGQDAERAPLDALQAQLLATLTTDAGAALERGDAGAAAKAWQRRQDAVEALDVAQDAAVLAQEATLATMLQGQLDAALARYDRRAAEPALAVVAAWTAAPAALRARADEAAKMVAVGERFTGADGIELVLARASDDKRPALAVMAAAVDAPLYQRYASAKGRAPIDCANAPAPAQGCLALDAATELAAWLGEQTQHPYRVPSRDELVVVAAHVDPANARAWTSTCKEVRVAQSRNAASRTWSGVRKLFGKAPTAPKYATQCGGHFTVKLDGQGGDGGVQVEPTADTVVVLVRDMAGDATPTAR